MKDILRDSFKMGFGIEKTLHHFQSLIKLAWLIKCRVGYYIMDYRLLWISVKLYIMNEL